jgi:peptidyl-prolyl cis-trans isomerase B (cyclophilin B)
MEIQIRLLPDMAPYTVNNFVFLACSGFYDGLSWHRLESFIAVTGDPTGTGQGGPGYTIPDEFNHDSFDAYMVGMVKMSTNDSGGSQFFVALEDRPSLDGEYTMFGVSDPGSFTALWQRQNNDSTYYLSPKARIIEITIQEGD